MVLASKVTKVIHSFQLHLFAANEPVSGKMGGISGADQMCFHQATAAKLNGTYRAFITSKTQTLDSLISRVEDKKIPVFNAKVVYFLLAVFPCFGF